MSWINNLSIRQIVSFTTLLVWLIQSLILLVLWYAFDIDIKFTYLLVFALVSLGVLYFTISYVLDRFIFRKVKLIYKFITDTKVKPNEKSNRFKEKLNTLTMDEVRADVKGWAERTEKEIEDIKSLEEYRRNFVGNISHELKTPLFSIQGYLHTLLDGAIFDKDINVDYVKRAARNTERLQNIVNDLEMINKLESESFELNKSNFILEDIVREIFDDLKTMASAKNIAFKFKGGVNIQTKVYADKEAIRQVLVNLIVNAIKYGRKDGKVTISFYQVNSKILTEVTDDGIGIDEDHIKHLFDRFYRVNSSRSRAEGGSGLGLSIVKHTLEVHGEKIFVRSTPDVGTTFGFTLPKTK